MLSPEAQEIENEIMKDIKRQRKVLAQGDAYFSLIKLTAKAKAAKVDDKIINVLEAAEKEILGLL
tara:strand:- start:2063 stop:2257 length:195 start_codon:yes stop_codon:yes gene_type:complete